MQTGEVSSHPSQSFVASIPTNLPRSLTPLVGRAREAQAVRDLILRHDIHLVTLTGLGGAGKTTLALHVASSLFEQFSGGVFFVNLASLTDGSLILDAIGQTLKVPEEQRHSLLESLSDFFHGRPILLALDNLEQILEGAAQISALLEACPQLKILTTSREALRLRGEHTFSLAPLSESHALELFVQRAKAVKNDFELTDDARDAVLQICQKLDGLPLAIELAAQRMNLFSARSLLQRLHSDLGADSPILSLLTSGSRDLPSRQRTLRDAIAWSYSLLTESERRLFRVAALFPAGAGIESIASVSAVPEMDAMEGIASLVDKSLLRSVEGEFPRVVMLETLREFAREESSRLGESASDLSAFVAYYASFMTQASEGLKGRDQIQFLKKIEIEQPNLLLAFDAGLNAPPASPAWVSAFAILSGSHRYWMMRGIFHIGEQLAARGRLALDRYGDKLLNDEAMRLKAETFSLSGSIAWSRGKYIEARDSHQAAYDLFQQLNDVGNMAEALNNLGVNLSILGEYEKAIASHRMGVALCREVGDAWMEMRQLNNMGSCLSTMDQIDEAYEIYRQGLTLSQELDDEFFTSVFLVNLANIDVNLRRYEDARPLVQRAVATAEAMDMIGMQAWARMLMAQLELETGNLNEAIYALREGIFLSDHFYDADTFRLMLWVAISICVETKKFPAAATLYEAFDQNIRATRVHLAPMEAEQVERNFKLIRTRLSLERFRTARALGASMDPRAAFAFWMDEFRDLWEEKPSAQPPSRLTAREMDVLKLLAAGKTNGEISKGLVVALKTVEKHTANVMRKLGVKNRTEAAAWALEHGIK